MATKKATSKTVKTKSGFEEETEVKRKRKKASEKETAESKTAPKRTRKKKEETGNDTTEKKAGRSTGRKKRSPEDEEYYGKQLTIDDYERENDLIEEEEARAGQKEKNPLIPEFGNEIVLLITLVISLLLILSNFKVSGKFGEMLNNVTFGLFGFLAYIIPFLLFVGVAFYLANRKENRSYIPKLIAMIGLFIILSTIIQLLSNDASADAKIADYYLNSAKTHSGGGFFGGILCRLLVPLVGRSGSFVVLAALEILCLMLFSGQAFFAVCAEIFDALIKKDIEKRQRREKENEELEKEIDENGGSMSDDEDFYLSGNYSTTVGKNGEPLKKNFFGGITPTTPVGERDNSQISDTFDYEQSITDNGSFESADNVEIIEKADDRVMKPEQMSQADNMVDVGQKLDPDMERLYYVGEYKPSKDTVDTVNSIYEEELRKKFERNTSQSAAEKQAKASKPSLFGFKKNEPEKQEMKPVINTENRDSKPEIINHINNGSLLEIKRSQTAPVNYTENKAPEASPVNNVNKPVYGVIPDRNERTADENDAYARDILEDLGTKQEPSFSETSLSDMRNNGGKKYEKTIFDNVPYGLGAAKKTVPAADDPDIYESGDVTGSNMQTSAEAQYGDNSVKQNNKATASDMAEVSKEIQAAEEVIPEKKYEFPPIELLTKPVNKSYGDSEEVLLATAEKLKNVLDSFGVKVTVTNVSCGPSVTRYELQPEQGVKVSKITGLTDDIKLNLAAADVRIEAPIPGKAAVGIEVPNKDNATVYLRELIQSKEFTEHRSNVAFTVGKDIGGQNIIADIAKMPHLLIAGATGSGKSVCINTIIMSILYKADPSDVKLIMVDPKVVELSVYNGIPHLLIPVVTNPKKASAALNWAVNEMTERYNKFAMLNVRDFKGYNEKVKELDERGANEYNLKKMPQMVIIVDELADLMMVASGEVEDAICRLAQMARAAGMHLILATQRPSVNVITGLIKANVPSRIAFAVSSGIDSRTILDSVGAEKLLGKGDMLFFPSGYPKPVRIQGAFVSDKEVSAVVEFLKNNNSGHSYSDEIAKKIESSGESGGSGEAADDERDEYFYEAGKFIIEKEKASIGMLQRVFKIGFNRAGRIMDQLYEAGVVGPEEGTKPRQIVMTMEEFEQLK